MSIEVSLALELERRAQVLPNEVAQWRALTDSNVEGLGIHRSQIEAVTVMLEVLLSRQRAALESLGDNVDKPEFPTRRIALERELSGGHGIMAVFQHILAQRQIALVTYRLALDAADLVAAECYRHCMEKARVWQVLNATHFREPPLTYLNAALSPTAATRRHQLGLFGLPGEGITELRLPVSVLSLPFDHTAALWTYCALYHEVGHPLDQDLQLAEALESPVQQIVAAERWPRWRSWLREMTADVFGVALGGVAYARSLAMLLIRPTADVTVLDPHDKHPNPYVRIFLTAEMLRRFVTQVPEMGSTAGEIEELWKSRYQVTDQLAPFLSECPAVVNALLDTKLDALKGHALKEFGESLASDHATMMQLASWLQTGFKRPEPAGHPVRLVPGAAQLAVAAVATAQAATYAGIHERAAQFIQAIPRPQFLGPVGAQPTSETRNQFFRDLTEAIRFGPAEEEE